MNFQISKNFFNEHVNLRGAQVIGLKDNELSLPGLEWQMSTTPYYDFSFHEKALFRPAYHLLHLVHDALRLLESIALAVASLYFDRSATTGLLGKTLVHAVLMLSDVVLAAASVVTFVTRSIASLCSGYLAKDVPGEPNQKDYGYNFGLFNTHSKWHQNALRPFAPALKQEKELDKRTVNYEYEPEPKNTSTHSYCS
ncbi:MAG: hypothetical protein P1U36_05070 [Legionellaceae bacterium]|nr:hypothetical protein [Legionellaceae bacterium]